MKTVQSSWNQYFRFKNDYPTILLNEKWPIKPSVLLDEDGLHVTTCKFHDEGDNKMYFFLFKVRMVIFLIPNKVINYLTVLRYLVLLDLPNLYNIVLNLQWFNVEVDIQE